MATTTTKKRNIKYLGKDFEGFKRDLTEHLKTYFPNTVQDFNESNSALMMAELISYIGDNFSFYLDKKQAESFSETAREAKNVMKHGRQLGFKPFGKTSAQGKVDGYLEVPATTVNQKVIPNMSYAGTIKRGAKLKSKSGRTYETLLDADFSEVDVGNSALVRVGDRDPNTSVPRTFVLKKTGIEVKAGETKTATFTVGGYKAFRKIALADDDVLEILEVTDAEGNSWYEVDYLVQDTVFDQRVNTGNDVSDVPYTLTLRSVPYRFISQYDIVTKKTSLIFGTGDAQNFDGQLIPDLGDLALPLYGKDTFTDVSIDPQNFLKTRTLGLAPVNTTLTVKYRVGGGANTNAGTGEVNSVVNSVFEIGDTSLSTSAVREVGNSFEVLNTTPIVGGRDELSLDEIRQLIPAVFSAQSRLVVPSDFIARSLSMPSRFGSVFRANAKLSQFNANAVELLVLAKNSDGYVTTAPGDLKTNLKKYLSRFRMMTDAIEILDGQVVNLAVEFSVLTIPDINKGEVLANCLQALQDFFETDAWQLGQPINIDDVRATLRDVVGVLSVVDINFFNRVGTYDGRTYSSVVYNIADNTENGIIYSRDNVFFEIKYKNKDIRGLAK